MLAYFCRPLRSLNGDGRPVSGPAPSGGCSVRIASKDGTEGWVGCLVVGWLASDFLVASVEKGCSEE